MNIFENIFPGFLEKQKAPFYFYKEHLYYTHFLAYFII